MSEQEKPAGVMAGGLSKISLQLGICEQQGSKPRRSEQESGRASEIASRRHHLVARRCGGAIGRAEIALAEHYGRVARRQFAGGRHG